MTETAGCAHDDELHAVAPGAAQHNAGCVRVRAQRRERVASSTVRARANGGREVRAEHFVEQTADRVAVERQFLVRSHRPLLLHVPGGPNSSVLIRSARRLTRSSDVAADSTSAVGPQMNVSADAPNGRLTSASIASSIRREYPVQPAECERVSVWKISTPPVARFASSSR